jgi:DNA primase
LLVFGCGPPRAAFFINSAIYQSFENITLAVPKFPMIKPATIQSIMDAARIEEVVGDFITLKKRGANYLGLCPFHNEKTPSFSVSPSKGIFKCFGCGKAGNAVGFIMDHEHYSYPEALRWLARKYGIDVEEEEMTPEMQQELDERESMFVLNDFMAKYFARNLTQHDEGKSIGMTYLKERDFTSATIEKFQLGYAIDQWEDYCKQAIKNGYQKEVLVKTGLGIEKDSRLIDRFRGRIIFPIHNLTGRVIGFGGRILSSEKSTAKYINSPESEIYNKSKALYGVYYGRNAIVKEDNCYLVEGYTDVISLHQAGFENVVASSGTSLTEDQIKLIRRFTQNITMLFDGDPAGIKASFRGIDLILEQGMNVRVVMFPDGEDPDSFVRSHRTSEVEAFIKDKAMDFIKFKTTLLLDETAGDPAGKARLIKDIVASIAFIPDGITRSVYIKECSQMMEVPEQTLMNELNKMLRQKFRKKFRVEEKSLPEQEIYKPSDEQKDIEPLDVSLQEDHLMRVLLLYGNKQVILKGEDGEQEYEGTVADFIISDLKNDQINFENALYNEMLEEYIRSKEQDKYPDENHFIKHQRQAFSKTAIDLISNEHQLSENWRKNKIYVKMEEDQLSRLTVAAVLALKSRIIGKQLKQLSEDMKTANEDGEIFILQQQYYELKLVSNQIDAILTRTFSY